MTIESYLETRRDSFAAGDNGIGYFYPLMGATPDGVKVNPSVVQLLDAHLAALGVDDPDALVFTGDKGAALRRSNLPRQANWTASVAMVGASGLDFHDLRHTGNHLAAQSGASLRDLMIRMGHDGMRAALIYQRATDAGDRRIADALDAVINGATSAPEAPVSPTESERSCTRVARRVFRALDDNGAQVRWWR